MSIRSLFVRHAAVGVSLLAMLLVGCSKHATKDFAAPYHTAQLNELIVAATAGGTAATYVTGTLPQGPGMAPTVAGSDTFVAGGATQFIVTVPDTATALNIGVANVPGYYHVPLTGPVARYSENRLRKLSMAGISIRPAGVNARMATVDYVVVITPVATATQLHLVFTADAASSRSVVAHKSIASSYRASGSGVLQVSLSWNADVDLDLHVVTPDSVDIYYGNMSPDGQGGTLDLDSNAACGLDHVDNENISWGNNIPEQGDFDIRVDLWSACDVTEPIPFVVTVRKCGLVTAFPGTFNPGEADHGGAFAGRLMTTVNFAGCGAPAAAARPWRGLSRLAQAR